MTDKKISDLDVASALDGTELLEVVQGDNVQTTAQDIADLAVIPTTLPPSGPAGGVLDGDYPNPSDLAADVVDTLQLVDEAVTEAKIDPTLLAELRALALGAPYSNANLLSSTNPASNDAPYVSRTGCQYYIAQGNVAFKTNSRKGVVTALTPSTLSGSTRGGAIYLGNTLHQVLFFGGGGFILMDVDNDSFGTLVAPTSWGQISAAYHAGSGYVYYASSDKPRRCLVDGTSNSAGDAVTGTPSRVCIVGDFLFILDDTGAGASKVWKYDTTAWPTRGSAITLGGDTALYSGLAAHTTLSYLLVGGFDGTLLVVNPTTLATVATITLSGVTGRITQYTIYDATADRIYAIDATGKVWVIDGASPFTVLGYILPYNETPTLGVLAGLTYDGDLGFLTTRINGSSFCYRHRA